ncbi:hypothetical protein HELRODRAFT_172604 [Helobdella robusta]|uniref:BACK domain-containing protein n=1 Tax=Helobdella robusta TaxID=6412 RepID=T1F5L7_HELRO|nr:hypothetical protein HELRODRAFT_172604 [Helobdella robusta]ESO04248.1 hypothetical protein HELRODRAFT_172604 [Helobdella robusta]
MNAAWIVFHQRFQLISVYNFMKSFEEEINDADSTTLQFRTSERLERRIPQLGYKTCTVDNCLYLAGGNKYNYFTTKKLYTYNFVTSIWTKRCSMNNPRCNFYFGEMDGHLYAVSGSSYNTSIRTVEKYIPQEDRWLMLAPLPVATYRSGGMIKHVSVNYWSTCDVSDDYDFNETHQRKISDTDILV